MVTRCGKCGQTVLETDSICWHCGAQQTGKKTKSASNENGQGKLRAVPTAAMGNTAVVEEEPPVSLTAVSAYALFTLLSFMMLIFILRFLANQPLFSINPELERNPSWQSIADENLQFTLDVPPTWTNIENEENIPTGEFAETMKQLQADKAFMELEANLAGDIVPYMLIQTDKQPAYLLITGSKGLQTASNNQIMDLVSQSGWDVLRMSEIEPTNDDFRVNVAHYWDQNKRETRCTTQFILAEDVRYILIGCAPSEQFPQAADDITKMIALFQPLIYQN